MKSRIIMLLVIFSVTLQTEVDGANFEVEEMYPAYDAVAKLQDEKGAIRSIHYTIEAEKIHAAMFTEAGQAVKSGQDADLGDQVVVLGPLQLD